MINWLRRLFFRPKTGAILQPTDKRDYKFEDSFKAGELDVKTIPSLYEWGVLPNQKGTNACVGFSVARLLEILVYQVIKEESGSDYYEQVSELFTWYLAREMEDTEGMNVGVYPRDAFKAVFQYGYLPYDTMPFIDRADVEPSEEDYKLGAMVRDLLISMRFKYYAVSKKTSLELIDKGQAVAVSLPVSTSWYYNRYGKDTKPSNSYHYMVMEDVVEHNKITYIKLSNWWGKGYLYVPKTYFDKYARDLWTLARK